ncbi:MAG: HEAT repeat domain-containing protein, partial [Phycisphaeraceae bacterium]
MPRKPRRRFWVWTIVTTFILTTAAIPVAQLTLPSIYRWHNLKKLVSDDPQTRAQGHTFLINRAATDELVVKGAIEKLEVKDDQVFFELVLALDQAGVWTLGRIPRPHWIRFLARMAGDKEPEARLRAAQMLADLPDSAGEAKVIELFRKLTTDEAPEVRFNAMICAAEMRGAIAAKEKREVTRQYDALLVERTQDEKPMVARHAWMLLGLINDPSNGVSASWRKAEPDVAEAMMWMALHTNPDVPQPAIEALGDETVSPQVRAMAATMLGHSDAKGAREALSSILSIQRKDITPQNQIVIWRAILALRLGNAPKERNLPDVDIHGYSALVTLVAQCMRIDYENVTLRPLILASVFRDRRVLLAASELTSDLFTIADDPVAWLASLEGVAEARREGRA